MARIDNIPSGIYDGYYWMSNENHPEHFENSPLPDELKDLDSGHNPFVIEAQLFDKENEKSISVKYVDGTYIIHEYNLTETESDNQSDEMACCFTLKKYFANRIDGKKLIFRQYWKEEKDPLCDGMHVLQPAEMVFVGFEPIKTEKKDEG